MSNSILHPLAPALLAVLGVSACGTSHMTEPGPDVDAGTGRTCLSQEDCDGDQHCALPARCGVAGTCEPGPCTFDLVFYATCDGECRAGSSNCAPAPHSGFCSVVMDAGPPLACGTRGGVTCDPSEYCDFGTPSLCGADDGGGTCRPRPTECSGILSPVCGCDGLDYPNACLANQAGVTVASEGACSDPGGSACSPAEPCLGECLGTSCGGVWRCSEGVPCTDDEAPFCGCDGNTFYGSSTCPQFAYAHRGPCTLSCDTSLVRCRSLPPTCPSDQTPSVDPASGCWGPCVEPQTCPCTSDAMCPDGLVCAFDIDLCRWGDD